MPVDPAPFLSTVILASAALVAIVGGLLVTRFVGLDSDQQASRKLLADAADRLAIARRRAEAAQQDLLGWRAQDFLDEDDVAAAIADGHTDIRELRKLARTRLRKTKPTRTLYAHPYPRAGSMWGLSLARQCGTMELTKYRGREALSRHCRTKIFLYGTQA